MKYLVEVEIRGALEAELRAADTVGGCFLVERMVRNGIVKAHDDEFVDHKRDVWVTVRAMEHVTVPTGRVP